MSHLRPEFEDRNYNQSLLDMEITTEKIIKVINAMKQSKSQCPEMTHLRLLKKHATLSVHL